MRCTSSAPCKIDQILAHVRTHLSFQERCASMLINHVQSHLFLYLWRGFGVLCHTMISSMGMRRHT